MKFLAVVALAFTVAAVEDKDSVILQQNFDISREAHSFSFNYESDNGIFVQETGALRQPSPDAVPSLEVQGSVRYEAPDGTPVEWTFRADEEGYHPQGDIIPTPPPIPAPILRSLEYLATKSPPESIDARAPFVDVNAEYVDAKAESVNAKAKSVDAKVKSVDAKAKSVDAKVNLKRV